MFPDSLENLTGPVHGLVVLPLRVVRSGLHTYDRDLPLPARERPDQRKATEAKDDHMVPSPKIFFEEVRRVYAATADSLDLAGPVETENVIPVSTYTGGGVEYSIELDVREGTVDCTVGTEADSVAFSLPIEQLALATGAIEARGRISYSARNLTQLSNAQDLWIGSRRARGRRTFPNDPVMVTEWARVRSAGREGTPRAQRSHRRRFHPVRLLDRRDRA
ncbi:hypothetical protein ACIQVK_49425 [Streptomyces sp. NPDC090493]|uniref:hypothetical protein n=1 Tax=Streptomyces sp. NPDC090493 TaxID=3365964 RepID=UPI00382970F4